ncbi:dehydrodolichyl diphosphate synthase complex subunit nus1 [Manduca sexta]|uniref:dehydrodolichyl diphosphate synthase complex subunit nus1 n=1 Tax=Manduca sexta TaxID=7130 RepID=UPI0018909E83|nr:dehydrodolichyl diphosphate synthase complex subunit nus1 [Manduca sexta]
MLSRLLRQFLFTLVHLIVNVLVTVQNVYLKYFHKKFNNTTVEVTKCDIKLILEHVPQLTKRPKHLLFLSDNEHHSLKDLAKVVIWCLVAGVPYVSFHDVTGELKKNEEKLFQAVERNKRGIPGCIKWADKPDLNGYTNGIQAHTVIVNIFSSYDGRPTIAQCIRQLAEEKIKYSRKSNEFTAQEFDEVLKFIYPSIPDPEVILYTGPLCTTRGALPWQIRLSEFIQLSKDHSVNIDSFVGAMYKYNKCDQRFGK